MLVSEIMTKNPAACLPTDSGTVAGLIMAQQKCGFVPVVADHANRKLIGVITDRDLLLRLTQTNQVPSELTIGDCMTKAVKWVRPDTDLEEAAKIMEEAAIHRVPVIENDRLVGVMSIKDIASAAKKQWAYAGPHVAERQLTEIIEAIAAAR